MKWVLQFKRVKGFVGDGSSFTVEAKKSLTKICNNIKICHKNLKKLFALVLSRGSVS